MRHIRIDDDEPRMGFYEKERALALERNKEVRKARDAIEAKRLIAREKAEAEEARKLAEAVRRVEEAREERRKEREIAEGSSRLLALAHRKTHQNRNAPTLEELSKLPYWTPENLAYVQFYLGETGQAMTRTLYKHKPITLYGRKFEWSGHRYVQNSESE